MNQRSIRRVALIGCDEDVLTLIGQGIELGELTVAAAIECNPLFADRLRQLAPETLFVEEWESILDGESVDVVIFAEPVECFLDIQERRAEQLKKAAAAGIDLVLFHPACDGLLGYELEMARSIARGRIVTACPEIEHPVFSLLEIAFKNLAFGAFEQVIIERSCADSTRGLVVRRFAKDAKLLRAFFGAPGKLSANGPSPESEDWSNLAVLLTTPYGPKIRWNLDPTHSLAGLRMTIIASSGRAQVTIDENGEVGTFTALGETQTITRDCEWADVKWREVAAAKKQTAQEEDAVWLDTCRDLDLAAALQRSINRGRVVELKIDRATETANFKGVMSAWGCLLLLGALLFFCIWSVVGALELTWANGPDETTSTAVTDSTKVKLFSNLSWRYLPMFFLALALVAFLGLQFLQLIIKPQQKTAPEENSPTPPKST